MIPAGKAALISTHYHNCWLRAAAPVVTLAISCTEWQVSFYFPFNGLVDLLGVYSRLTTLEIILKILIKGVLIDLSTDSLRFRSEPESCLLETT